MSNFFCCSNAVGTIPNQLPFKLTHIFDPVLQPDNQVIDDEKDPHFVNLYSKEIADANYWIGYSEGHDLNRDDIRNICGHICSYVHRTQGKV